MINVKSNKEPSVSRIAIAIALALLSTAAHAEFKGKEVSDAFDGKAVKYAVGYDRENRGLIRFRSHPASDILPEWSKDGVSAVIALPQGTFLCGDIDGKVKVETLAVVGMRQTPTRTFEWGVTESHTGLMAIHQGADQIASDLELATEVRLRFVDSCGERYDLVFSSEGYREAAAFAGIPTFNR